MEAIRVRKKIEKKGELNLHNLPLDKGQEVEVLVLINSPVEPLRPRLTARDLLHSGLIGLWKDRQDIGDSVDYAQKLRDQAQHRIETTRKSKSDSAGH